MVRAIAPLLRGDDVEDTGSNPANKVVGAEDLTCRAAGGTANAGMVVSEELYSDTKASVGEPLAIDHAGEGSEFASE